MRRRVRLTESDLHRIVKESVKRVLREGQGWNGFKQAHKRVWDGEFDDEDPSETPQQFKNYIRTGDDEGDDYEFYDELGSPTNYDTGKKINKSWRGKLGRRAAVAGAKASLAARKTYNKFKK